MFDGDFESNRRFADRDHRNIVQWPAYDHPAGHYAAPVAPGVLAADLRAFLQGLG